LKLVQDFDQFAKSAGVMLRRRFAAPQHSDGLKGGNGFGCSENDAGDPFTMRQSELYEPIRRWLATDGFAATVTGANLTVVIPIAGLVSMPYKVPDVVGTRDGRVAIVEVEQNKARFFEALGRCMLWKCAASYVYLALPIGALDRAPILHRLGIGLLTVDPATGAVTASIRLPREGLEFMLTQELHPLDPVTEQQLYRQLEASCI
jgi:hypothetical protein